MKFQSIAHESLYHKVAYLARECFGDMAEPVEDYPYFNLACGSFRVRLGAEPFGTDDALVSIYSWIVEPKLCPELMNHLLRTNSILRFGAFSIDSDGDIAMVYRLPGKECGRESLKQGVLAVMATMNCDGTEIMRRWGSRDNAPAPEEDDRRSLGSGDDNDDWLKMAELLELPDDDERAEDDVDTLPDDLDALEADDNLAENRPSPDARQLVLTHRL